MLTLPALLAYFEEAVSNTRVARLEICHVSSPLIFHISNFPFLKGVHIVFAVLA
jgi:hypothetical protein